MMQRINHHIDHKKIALATVLLVIGILNCADAQRQRAQFTQYISNELIINPAYAGAEEALNVALQHRSQWSGFEGAPTTQTLTAHSLFKSKNVGLGLLIINDKIGVHKVLDAMTSYAYHLYLNESTTLSFGLQVGFNQRKSDYSSLSSQLQVSNDPTLDGASLQETSFAFGSGIYLKGAKFNLGISMPDMLPSTSYLDETSGLSFDRNNIYFIGRYRFTVTNNVHLQPGLLVKYLHGFPLSYDANLAGIFNDVLLVGFSYRSLESVSSMVQAKITPQLKIGYSFDYGLEQLEGFGSNSHEFMISYLFHFSNYEISSPR